MHAISGIWPKSTAHLDGPVGRGVGPRPRGGDAAGVRVVAHIEAAAVVVPEARVGLGVVLLQVVELRWLLWHIVCNRSGLA